MSQRRRRQSSLFIKHVQTSTLFLFMILSLADRDRKEGKTRASPQGVNYTTYTVCTVKHRGVESGESYDLSPTPDPHLSQR